MVQVFDDLISDDLISKLKEIRTYQRPAKRAYYRVYDWLNHYQPLDLEEGKYIQWREELVSLRSGDSDTFNGRIQSLLVKSRFRPLQVR